MKLEKVTEGIVTKIKFVAETEREKLILGDLRHHYFYGNDEDGTYPDYDGIDSEDNYVTAMKFKYNLF